MQWVLGALSSGIKRLGREANHSPPHSAEVENGGAISPAPATFFLVYLSPIYQTGDIYMLEVGCESLSSNANLFSI
jgi:hypothetical protein